MNMTCECNYCKNQNIYDPREYQVDLNLLDKQRLKGLSGILNTRADSLTIEACIESVIKYLDELIVTYHCPLDGGNSDSTYEILNMLLNKYPDKIKIFNYRAPIFDTHENKISSLERNIHTLANLHNFGMLNSSYSHYIRIDGDHIYFPRFMKILSDKIKHDSNMSDINNQVIDVNKECLYGFYISSVNVFPYSGRWYVSKCHDRGIEIFSGLGDHIVHPIASDYFYVSKTDENGKTLSHDELEIKYNLEKKKHFKTYWLGFSSFHLKHVAIYNRYHKYKNTKPHTTHYFENVFSKKNNQFLHVDEFVKMDFCDIEFILSLWSKNLIESMWDKRDDIDMEVLNMIDVNEFNYNS